MPKLVIDNRKIEVERGDTILHAASKLGINIPTLCFRDGCEPSTSCMVCVVKANGRIVPSCATVAQDGMEIESETDEIYEARRTALELLLSDHQGDCIAPCQRTCPANMDIPLMLRQIASNKLEDAIATVKNDIALPAILGRICPAPCEKACRRGTYDEAISICHLKQYVADADLASNSPYLPLCKPENGKKVAIVGAGPAGLAAAYYLLQDGYSCMIFDDHEKPGGMLRYGITEDRLPHDILDREIGGIRNLGIDFQMRKKIGVDVSISELQQDSDAVLIASGNNELTSELKIDRNTLETDLEGVFVAGNAVGRKGKMAVRSVADGKNACISIGQHLSGLPVTGHPRLFTVAISRLTDEEIGKFMLGMDEEELQKHEDGKEVNDKRFLMSASVIEYPVPDIQKNAITDATRCLHCDCRATDNCKLKDYSAEYGAAPGKYKSERRLFQERANKTTDPPVIYDPGKCIKCGLCIQITSRANEDLGLAFVGRGFDVQIDVPFNRTLAEGLQKVASECVQACPTGALVFRKSI